MRNRYSRPAYIFCNEVRYKNLGTFGEHIGKSRQTITRYHDAGIPYELIEDYAIHGIGSVFLGNRVADRGVEYIRTDELYEWLGLTYHRYNYLTKHGYDYERLEREINQGKLESDNRKIRESFLNQGDHAIYLGETFLSLPQFAHKMGVTYMSLLEYMKQFDIHSYAEVYKRFKQGDKIRSPKQLLRGYLYDSEDELAKKIGVPVWVYRTLHKSGIPNEEIHYAVKQIMEHGKDTANSNITFDDVIDYIEYNE